MKLAEDFPDLLSNAREVAGLTQRQLADQLGISHTQVARYERGQSIPRPGILAKIGDALGLPLEELRGSAETAGPKRFQDGWVKTALRVPPDLHSQLHESAVSSGRTFNAEIVHRLQSTFLSAAGGVTLDNDVAERLIAALQSNIQK